MKQSWKDYDKAGEHGPMSLGVKSLWGAFVLVLFFIVLGWGLSTVGCFTRLVSETTSVAFDEFGPKAALEKYEWLKDASAQLDKKKADIAVYKSRFAALEASYKGEPRSKWAKDDREQHSIWASEVSGVIASYNGLAAEYNAQMAKFNWRFANVGDLPKGADVPLPREFKPYATE
jgi:hypothetical protein